MPDIDIQTPADDVDLIIRISRGVGQAPTQLAAFDEALRDAGVADFNLIRLSSVIPPRSRVDIVAPEHQITGGFGDALYCVYAAAWSSTPGTEVWAGVGWSRRQDDSGAGLFVEHVGGSEAEVREQVTGSLESMSRQRGGAFELADQVLSSARCATEPVCALVLATYRAVGWVPTGTARR